MLKLLFSRVAQGLAVLLGIVTVIFALFNLMPGDPVQLMLGQRTDALTVQRVRTDLGLDLPAPQRFAMFLNDLSPIALHQTTQESSVIYLDRQRYGPTLELLPIGHYTLCIRSPYLRRSYQYQRPVSDMIIEALPGTGILALLSMALATVFGVSFGIVGALKRGQWPDRVLMVFSVFGMSLPSFVAALLAVWVFAYVLGAITGLPVAGSLYEVDEFSGLHLAWPNLILPTFTISIRPLAVIMQLMRDSMLETLNMDFVRTATAKGLDRYTVVVRHAMRNALGPVITAVSGWLASLLAGAVFVEIVFGWKGIGLLILNALNTYDLPVVMGCLVFVSAMFVAINLLVDLLYAAIDPRIRLN